MPGAGRTLRFDVVVVGAGVAGLVAALDILREDPHRTVAVLDKGVIGSSGSTPLAQGGMAAAVGPDDSPALHAADTIRAGDGLCDLGAVEVVARETPERIADLVRWGARFDRNPDGSFALAREGGQQVARSVRTADASGAEIFRALREAATGRVTRLQGLASSLAVADGRAVGVWTLLDDVEASVAGPAQEAGLALVLGDAVVLATGGCGGLYAATTNRDTSTGDGVALAYEAGAALIDMEFVQFHPTGLKVSTPESGQFWRLLLTEALRGAGARLVDAEGRRFMVERHPDAELGPRHIVTKGILDQPTGAWLDATHLPQERLAEEFPTVLAGARAYGYDLASEPVPVEPCEHYMVGGVATDLDGRSTLPGLWAAGEVASTGVHGANRMAGNSLAQSCVFGHRAARSVVAALRDHRSAPDPDPDPPTAGVPSEPPVAGSRARAEVQEIRADLRRAMTAGLGAIRNTTSLDGAAIALDAAAAALGSGAPDDRESVELAHMLTVGRLMLGSARLRTESRGVHWRSDHPSHSPDWEGRRIRVSRPLRAVRPDGQG